MKTFSLLILLFYFINISASDKISIVDTNKVWSVMHGSFMPGGSSYSTYSYKFGKDTVINDLKYYLVYESLSNTLDWYYSDKAIREDSGRVYLLDDEMKEEKILYDFNLEVNDTIELIPESSYHENNWIVYKIDSVELNGKLKKRISLVFEGEYDIWIEGIGSTFGVLFSGFLVPDINAELLCVWEHGTKIYSNPEYDFCYKSVGIDEQKTKNNDIKIYPTIVNCILNIEAISQENRIQIISIKGNIVYDEITNLKRIDISEIDKGFYFVRIFDEVGKTLKIEKIIKQ